MFGLPELGNVHCCGRWTCCLLRMKDDIISTDEEDEHNACDCFPEVVGHSSSGMLVESFLGDEELARTAVIFQWMSCARKCKLLGSLRTAGRQETMCCSDCASAAPSFNILLRDESVLQTPGQQVLHHSDSQRSDRTAVQLSGWQDSEKIARQHQHLTGSQGGPDERAQVQRENHKFGGCSDSSVFFSTQKKSRGKYSTHTYNTSEVEKPKTHQENRETHVPGEIKQGAPSLDNLALLVS